MVRLALVHQLLDALVKNRHYGTVQIVFDGGQIKYIRSDEVWKEEEIAMRL